MKAEARFSSPISTPFLFPSTTSWATMKTLVRLIAAAAALAAMTAARADITIGVTLAQTGPGASLGAQMNNGLALWPQSIGGEKLKLIILDDAGDPTAATRNARRFVFDDKVDAIVGSANTPSTIAVAQVANEGSTVQLSPSPVELPEGKDPWVFRSFMHADFWAEAMVQHLQKSGVKTASFLGYADALGEAYLKGIVKHAAAAGIKLNSIERFARSDTSITSQVLKVTAGNPDAIFVIAVGGGAAMPQKALAERGYKGKVMHTSASVSPDFLRLAGKDAEGALLVSGPEQVPEQLPDSHPAKKTALEFVQAYEAKFGAGSRTQFAASVYDIGLLLQRAVPVALAKAKPGTPEFRKALKDALESTRLVVTKGDHAYSPTNHWGLTTYSRAVLVVQNGTWKLAP